MIDSYFFLFFYVSSIKRNVLINFMWLYIDSSKQINEQLMLFIVLLFAVLWCHVLKLSVWKLLKKWNSKLWLLQVKKRSFLWFYSGWLVFYVLYIWEVKKLTQKISYFQSCLQASISFTQKKFQADTWGIMIVKGKSVRDYCF